MAVWQSTSGTGTQTCALGGFHFLVSVIDGDRQVTDVRDEAQLQCVSCDCLGKDVLPVTTDK